eukprot:2353493-Amphidinium_carterae.3
MKMVEQSTQWFCKGAHALADGLRAQDALRLELGAFFFGKILHTIQDTFTLSHSRRNVTLGQVARLRELMQSTDLASTDSARLLQAMPIEQSYSMDDVSWSAHAALDKGRKYKESSSDATAKEWAAAALEDAAVLASAQVIAVFAELINNASSAGDVSLELLGGSIRQLGEVLCHTVFPYKNEDLGAG